MMRKKRLQKAHFVDFILYRESAVNTFNKKVSSAHENRRKTQCNWVSTSRYYISLNCLKRKQHSPYYEPWHSFPECQALVGCDRKFSVRELPVITQPFLFLRPRVSVEASSTSSLLDIAESSNRRVLTIISYEAVDRGPVSLLAFFV